MKEKYPEYFPLTEEELSALWSRSNIIFDTNVILRMYRYKHNTVNDILSLWEKIQERLWIPDQIAWEYNKNRIEKIKESEKIYLSLKASLSSCVRDVEKLLDDGADYGFHPSINLEDKVKKLIGYISDKTKEIDKEYLGAPTAGHYAKLHDRIAEIFSGRVGDELTETELSSIIEEGKSRYSKNEGPGHADFEEKTKKKMSDREIYGDLIIWKNVIHNAKLLSRPAIIVTEDTKSDWWLRREGQTVGPLPSLRREFLRESGQMVHFYRLQQFLEHAASRLNASVKAATVKDVERDAALASAEQESESKLHTRNIRQYLAQFGVVDNPKNEDLALTAIERRSGYSESHSRIRREFQSLTMQRKLIKDRMDEEMAEMERLRPALRESRIPAEALARRKIIRDNVRRYSSEMENIEFEIAHLQNKAKLFNIEIDYENTRDNDDEPF
ncbi:DUF4935 domain-containing protein [Roseomonas terrae]|uniref:DUF4935 domain-containing protein n=2 Tax=Neoroseomonas terrae TaxID=424799 RepID=A0ABS5EKD1_9PROT|nr:DUF4935 domain-containing protein [Neoroseomonas terrae]